MWRKWVGDMERIRNEIEEKDAQLQELGWIIQKASLVKAELDEEIRNLQAGEERRGSCASQFDRCCFDPTVVEQPITMGATLAWQQLAFIQGEISSVYGGRAASASASHSGAHTGGRRRRRRK